MISRKSLYKLFSGICFYCQKPITFEESTRDHFIPKIRGGSNRKDNIVLACGPCNRDKGGETDLDKIRFRNSAAIDTSVSNVDSEDIGG